MRESTIHTMIATIKATKYPERLFTRTEPIADASAAKQLKSKKVVDTGIRILVSINKNIGAAI
jgi:hypothetical protein